MKSRLEILRKSMKEKDREIIRLLNERSEISVQIGKVKGHGGIDVYDPSQEARVYNYLHELNCGPLPQPAIRSIFREIISASRDLQKPTTVAFLGPETSFSHLAARLHFGDSSRFFPQPGIARVFDEVERGTVDWGVVPVENSPGRFSQHNTGSAYLDFPENQGGNISQDQPVPDFFGERYKEH